MKITYKMNNLSVKLSLFRYWSRGGADLDSHWLAGAAGFSQAVVNNKSKMEAGQLELLLRNPILPLTA